MLNGGKNSLENHSIITNLDTVMLSMVTNIFCSLIGIEMLKYYELALTSHK